MSKNAHLIKSNLAKMAAARACGVYKGVVTEHESGKTCKMSTFLERKTVV